MMVFMYSTRKSKMYCSISLFLFTCRRRVYPVSPILFWSHTKLVFPPYHASKIVLDKITSELHMWNLILNSQSSSYSVLNYLKKKSSSSLNIHSLDFSEKHAWFSSTSFHYLFVFSILCKLNLFYSAIKIWKSQASIFGPLVSL